MTCSKLDFQIKTQILADEFKIRFYKIFEIHVNIWFAISVMMSCIQAFISDKFVKASLESIEFNSIGTRSIFDYPINFSLLTNILLFLQTTWIMIFNFWCLEFVLLVFKGHYAVMVYLACIMFGAAVFMEALKQLLSHLVIFSMIYFRNVYLQKICLLLTSYCIFMMIYFLAPIFKSIFFGTTESFFFFGFLWVP